MPNTVTQDYQEYTIHVTPMGDGDSWYAHIKIVPKSRQDQQNRIWETAGSRVTSREEAIADGLASARRYIDNM